MLIDTRILQRHGIFEVLAESQTIVFPDRASHAVLHFVQRNGVNDIYLRAMHCLGRWCVFDLRSIDRSFENDLRFAMHRDRPGMVMFGLRALFDSAQEFEPHVMQNLMATWLMREPMPRFDVPDVQRPALAFQPEMRRVAA